MELTQEVAALRERLIDMPSIDLDPRQACDLEMIVTGGFAPLTGFPGQADHDAIVRDMRLADGTLWPMTIPLDVDHAFAESVAIGDHVALRDLEGVPKAVLEITDIWEPNREAECQAVYGTTDPKHPGVARTMNGGAVYLGGPVVVLEEPTHHDFQTLRHTPAQVRQLIEEKGWERVVAFQTRNPLHRAHHAMTVQAMEDNDAGFLLHPVVGMTKPGDVDHFTRVRCYRAIMNEYPEGRAMLSLLPLAMRMAGPREALWHAIIRANYGATHFIVGRDHAGPGLDSQGQPFYGPYDAQELVAKHEEEAGIKMVPFRMMVHVRGRGYIPIDEAKDDTETQNISGSQLRDLLRSGADIPEWFSFASVVDELRYAYPARKQQGFTVFFTGLSGAGKSTIANALVAKLMEHGKRPVTLLDGDIVRRNLSSELGFSREHRDLNIQRIGFVASEITKNRGVAICAPIAPYDATRRAVRQGIEAVGGFVLVHLDTPLEVCESRDRKGLYAKARAGIIKEFTGISDPYEAPQDAEVVLDTSQLTPQEAADQVYAYLEDSGYL